MSDSKAVDFGGVSQEEFLGNIRRRAGARSERIAHPGSFLRPEGEEENATHSEKVRLFTQALEGLGGRVLRATTLAEAFAVVAEELAKAKAKRVLLAGGDFGEFEKALSAAGVAFDRWGELRFAHGSEARALERVDAWDAGVSYADYAVAELGSIALLFDAEQGRSVSLLPPRYVSFIRRDALVKSRAAVFKEVGRRFREAGRPGSFVFVTGPSRSADIEMDLSIGVHGPGDVWAVLVDE